MPAGGGPRFPASAPSGHRRESGSNIGRPDRLDRADVDTARRDVIHPRGSGPPELWFLHTRRTAMARKSYKPEEIVAKLRQVDVLSSQGQSVAAAIRSIGVSEVTYYRWRQEYDDMAG